VKSNRRNESDEELYHDSDDEIYKLKQPFHETPAGCMLKAVPLTKTNIKIPLKESELREVRVTRKDKRLLESAFDDFYSTSQSSRRDKFGWSAVSEPYSLYNFYQAKKRAVK